MGHNFTKVIISRKLLISYVKFLVLRDVSQGFFKFSLIFCFYFLFSDKFGAGCRIIPTSPTRQNICVYPHLRLSAVSKKTKNTVGAGSPEFIPTTNNLNKPAPRDQ